MDTHEKFLEFNGKDILFISVKGSYWIALKPLCEALELEYTRSFKNAKNDPILGELLCEQTIVLSKNDKKQRRKMICIPEEFIYGWLFSVKSESPELLNYKKTCYKLLYNHFHGIISNRKELLLQRRSLENQIANMQDKLNEDNPDYKNLQDLLVMKKQLNSQLGIMDKEIVKQPELFSNPDV